jgi:hypothetical protein
MKFEHPFTIDNLMINSFQLQIGLEYGRMSHLKALYLSQAAGKAADRLWYLPSGQHCATSVPAGSFNLPEEQKGYNQCSKISVPTGSINLTEEQKGKNKCSIELVQPIRGIEGLKPVFQLAHSTYQKTEELKPMSNGLVQPTRGTKGFEPVFQLAHSFYQINRREKTSVPAGSFNLPEEQKGYNQCSKISVPTGSINLTEEQKGKNQCSIELVQPIRGTEGLKPVLQLAHSTYQKTEELKPMSNGLVQSTRGTKGFKPVFQLAHSIYQINRREKTSVPAGSFNLPEEQTGYNQCSKISVPTGSINLTEEQKGKNQCSIELVQPIRGTEGLKPVFQLAHSTYQKTEELKPMSNGLVQPTRGTKGFEPVFQLAHSIYQINRREKTSVPAGSFNLAEESKG